LLPLGCEATAYTTEFPPEKLGEGIWGRFAPSGSKLPRHRMRMGYHVRPHSHFDPNNDLQRFPRWLRAFLL
jgi:hypothetical protein